MSGEDRRAETPQGPPWAVSVLADLHGDALDEEIADSLRPRVEADPDATAVLSALDATRDELAEQPPLSIPEDVVDRIERSLAAEFAAESGEPATADEAFWNKTPVEAYPAVTENGDGGADVVDIRRAREGRRRRLFSAGAGLIATAAAVLGAVFVIGIPGKSQDPRTDERPQAADPGVPSAAAPPLALRGSEPTLSGEQLSSVLSSSEYTDALSDPGRLIACLRANGVESGRPLGARRITLNGEPAQLLVLPAGEIGKFRLLAVGADCGSGNPATLSDTVVGG